MRQAVVIIHGIGEQRPMDTLRDFTRVVVGKKVRNKPDKMSSLFELRRVQSPGTQYQPLTDFYEYYWAHHMRDTKIRMLIMWLRSLLFRKPKNVSEKLKPYYFFIWCLIFFLSPFIYQISVELYHGNYIDSLFFIFPFLILLLIDYNILRIAYGTIDDAARYLNPHPDNIIQRNKIRQEGVELLDTLHKSKKYSRIIIVGHSLGSVIAYDLIRIYWSSMETPKAYITKKQTLLKNFKRSMNEIFTNNELTDNSKSQKYHELQLKTWKELRDFGLPWLITDFITAGSPLAHADMLLAKDKQEFERRKTEGEYPSCPPLDDHDIFYKINFSTSNGPR